MKSKKEVVEYINTLQGYEGYVQFSHRPIEEKDLFHNGKKVEIDDESGFVYEAHFWNESEKKSIAIKQINDVWLVDETDISSIADEDTQIYHASHGLKVRMAQVWEEENDPLCENMPVRKLKRVVFAGFEGEKQ